MVPLSINSPFSELLEFTRKFIPESKIALPCGASVKFRRFLRSKSRSRAEHPENSDGKCAPARSIMKIPSVFRSKSRSRAEHPAKIDENCAPVQSILRLSVFLYQKSCSRAGRAEILKNEFPCGASLKFRRFLIKICAPVRSILTAIQG